MVPKDQGREKKKKAAYYTKVTSSSTGKCQQPCGACSGHQEGREE